MISEKRSTDCYRESSPASNLWSGGWPQTQTEFRSFVDLFWERMVRIAYRRIRKYEEAEDVVQDVLVKAYTNRKQLCAVQQINPYLYRMVINACIERIRHRQTGTALEELERSPLTGFDHYALRQFENIEEISAVEALLKQLPHAQAQVLRYHVLDDFTLAEVAKITESNLSTVKSRLVYGLKKLRQLVEKERIMGSIAMCDAVESLTGLKSLHITAKIRLEGDSSFEMITPDAAFQPLDIWKVFGDTPKWRVQHPGRMVIMDGTRTLLFFPKPQGVAFAYQFPGNEIMYASGLLMPLLDIDTLFIHEQEAARMGGAQVSLKGEADATGAPVLVLTINSKNQGDYSQSNYMKNRSLWDSDNIRVYTFHATTHQLQSMHVYMEVEGAKILVFEITAIQYDVEIDPTLFDTTVPEGVHLLEAAEQGTAILSNPASTPKEAAETIFNLLTQRDWETLHAYAGTRLDMQQIQAFLGGLQIISLGEPFQSGVGPCWFVPYELQLTSGRSKQGNLSVRNDNPYNKWVLDGGL